MKRKNTLFISFMLAAPLMTALNVQAQVVAGPVEHRIEKGF